MSYRRGRDAHWSKGLSASSITQLDPNFLGFSKAKLFEYEKSRRMSVSDKPTIRASESVPKQPMAISTSNGCTVTCGMDLKWKFL
jgi:hypothetical protein